MCINKKGEKMKINRVNSQPNFTAAYVKHNGFWMNAFKEGTEASSKIIEKEYNQATERQALLLNTGKANLNIDPFKNEIGVIQKLRVVLIDKEAGLFNKLKDVAKRKEFFNNLFKDKIEIIDDLKIEEISHVDSNQIFW